uniref:Uncharacterized protein n=1 Tax=Solanum lycopersicum TaxID=4081 RepID=A0A3Q7JBC1_SOLLC
MAGVKRPYSFSPKYLPCTVISLQKCCVTPVSRSTNPVPAATSVESLWKSEILLKGCYYRAYPPLGLSSTPDPQILIPISKGADWSRRNSWK